MARKSRRNEMAVNQPVLNQDTVQAVPHQEAPWPQAVQLRTAAYARLSREKEDDSTIQTQVELLRRFISDAPELVLTDTYIDNGVTGTTFDRPEFNRMMEDVYNGRIQCIVVKDLSRFGRNMIEAGYYIETAFPKMDVRFIAITDQFDSSRREDRESITVPIRNMVNDFYAKDFSKKQVAAFELHSRLGDRRILSTPYGYQLDRSTNTMLPDPETVPVVQLIFRWFLMGVSGSEIAHRLNDIGVPSPREYKAQRGFGSKGERWETWASDRLWNYAGVRHVLENRVYIGDWVLGKERSAQYKSIKCHRTRPEEWIIHEGRHEAVVAAADFEAVQEMFENSMAKKRSQGRKPAPEGVNIFHQKVRCLECGRGMFFYNKKYESPRNTGAFYKCYAANRHGDTSTTDGVRRAGMRFRGSMDTDGKVRDCGKKVNEDYVKLVAMDALRHLVGSFCDLRQVVGRVKNTYSGGKLGDVRLELYSLNRKLETAAERREGLYRDFAEGLLTQEDYLSMKEHYVQEVQSLEESIRVLQEEQRRMERVLEQFMDWADRLSALGDLTLEKSMIDELFEYVGFGADGEIEVAFKCRDVFEETLEIIGYTEPEGGN